MTMFSHHIVLAIIGMLAVASPSAFAACGERGGPGYRGPNGKCIGWDALARVCGNPPTTRCTAEQVQPEADDAARLGAKIKQSKDAAHERANNSGR
jgi:hypothetical protein